MQKILGLDVGVASIGWAFLNEAENESETSAILGMGSRIIPLDYEAKDKFSRGISYSPNQSRRIKRGMRRNLQRYRLRRYKLIKILTDNNLQPEKHLFELSSLNLYQLHHRAVTEPITLQEIGRLLYHLNQKRGYRSSRKSNNEEEQKGNYLQAIAQRTAILTERNVTVGQYFYQELQADERFRIKEKIFTRACYMAEFEKIWQFQSKIYPTVLTDKLKTEIRDNIIYYQRPLRSQKDSVAACRYHPNHKVAPKSSPVFQISQIWQKLNNLTIEKAGIEIAITPEQKQLLFKLLNDTDKLSATEVKKTLGYGVREVTLNFEKLEGNRTRAALVKAFTEANIKRLDLLSFDPTDRPDDQPLYRLWHVLYSIDDPETLLKVLQKQPFGFTENEAITISKVGFKADFGSLSARAMRRILPFLEQGLTYDKACLEAGYKHSDSPTVAENDARILNDKLKIVKKNALRNPTVEKIINQIVNLVNEILANPALGRPDEIRVEMGRELKQNAKKRNDVFEQNKNRNKEHQNIEYRLQTENEIKKVSRPLLERYKLWQETGGISLYSGNAITLAAVLNGEVDVEHIIPKARLFDDSFLNKTLCERDLNAKKGDQTAFDFMENQDELPAYQERIRKLYAEHKISKAKRERLLMPATEIPDDFINRQLKETQYIAKTVKDMLLDVCRNVYTSTGSVTSHLRHVWGMEQILQELNYAKYDAVGKARWETNKEGNKYIIIDDWSKRDDHRHHAIDALVVACTSQSHIQKLNRLNQTLLDRRELKESAWKFPMPWPHFVRDAREAVAQILVSFKAGKKVATKSKNHITGQVTYTPRGPLHEETIYGQIMHKGKQESVVKYKLDVNFKPADVDFIVDESVKKAVRARLLAHNNDPKIAFKNLDQNPVWFNENQKIAIKAVRCLTGVKKTHELWFDEAGKPTAFVLLKNNHHVAIYEDENGNLHEKVTTFWEAVERLRNGATIINRQHEQGWKLIVSMQQNEMFVFGLSPDELQTAINDSNHKLISKHLYRVQSIAQGDYWFRHHLETQNDKTEAAKILKKYLRLSLDKMTGIKVKLNALGMIVKVRE